MKSISREIKLNIHEMNEVKNHPKQKTLDHIIPINKKCNGLHIMANVRYICRKCNGTRPKDGSDLQEDMP